jgi:hypothetical protein
MAQKNVVGLGFDGHIMRNGSTGSTALTTAPTNGPAVPTGTTPVVSDAMGLLLIDDVSLALLVTSAGPDLDGAWKIEVSNNYNATEEYGQTPNAGAWFDVTAAFVDKSGTAVAAVAHGTPATYSQYVQCGVTAWKGIAARHLRVTFTPSAGTGTCEVWAVGKGK